MKCLPNLNTHVFCKDAMQGHNSHASGAIGVTANIAPYSSMHLH